MEINIENVIKLINSDFRGNKLWFSEEIGIDYSYLLGILSGKRKPDSKKLCEKMIEFCKKRKLDYHIYIFLP